MKLSRYIGLLGVLIFLSGTCSYAQDRKLAPSIKGDFKLPVATSTKAFRDINDGVIDIDLVGQYPFESGFMLGIGAKVTYFEINDLALTPEVTEGDNTGWGVYGKVGYEKRTGASSFLEFAMNLGYSSYNYSTRQCEKNSSTDGFFFEPRIGLYLFATEQLAFGIITSYQFVYQDFGQEQLCLETLPRHDDADTEGTIGIFTIGLGFSTGLTKNSSVFR